MDSPLLYLTLCSMRNRLLVRLRRLREVRYAIGTIVGLGYFALVFGRGFFRGRRPPAAGPGFGGPESNALEVGGAVILLLVVALAWLLPYRGRPALAFTSADVQFLFTAPIARRRLLRYRILRSQIGGLFGSALITFFTRPGSVARASIFFVGVTLVTAVLNLHLTGASLFRHSTSLDGTDPGYGGARRRWLPSAIVLVVLVAILGDVATRWPQILAALGDGRGLADTARIIASGFTGIVLWPFRALAAVPLAGSFAALASALPPALLILALHYAWVIRSDTPFEEGSAELAEKMARVRTQGLRALRSTPQRATRVPFSLAATGPPEAAILWKNIISMGRFLSWTTLLRFIPAVIIFPILLTRGGGGSDRAGAFTFISLMIAGFAVLLGPQTTRSDLRQDLPNLAVLRTWPLRGATLVRGEVLAPAVVLGAVSWLALVAAAIFSTQSPGRFDVPQRWSYLIAAMAVAPGIILVQLLVQNAMAVTFPAWVETGRPRGGVDVMGQRLLLMAFSLLGLALAILPAAILTGTLGFAVRMLTGTFPVVASGLIAAVVLLAEAFVGSELIGSILDRTDVSALDPKET